MRSSAASTPVPGKVPESTECSGADSEVRFRKVLGAEPSEIPESFDARKGKK